MKEILPWLYFINFILLANHQIDAAYWKEWDLFHLPGGINGFLIVHFPLIFIILYGLILVFQQSPAGLIFSLILSAGGIFAFSIHMFFMSKGRSEFRSPMSLFILIATLVVSVIQAIVTIKVF